jgi:hypothetical protein
MNSGLPALSSDPSSDTSAARMLSYIMVRLSFAKAW